MEKVSQLKSINEKDKFNELFKFELEFQDGTIGMLYRKTKDSKVIVNEIYAYTINSKGTIKIIPEEKEYTGVWTHVEVKRFE